jgi:chromate transporter
VNAFRKAERIGTPGEVFGAFLKLGITSFGGPIAHLGYFRDELVIRRRWVTEPAYAELVALCQFLPGPASSQVGFSLGLARAGPLGALAAWVAFTLPSAVLMLLLALVSAQVDGPVAGAVFHALKLVAVVIVAQAVWGMARSLTPDLRRVLIAVAAGLMTWVMGGALGQVAAILLGAGAGVVACRHLPIAPGDWATITVRRWVAAMCLIVFALVLVMLPPIAEALGWRELRLFDLFYRAGALVFGGGHVVLPLLRATLVPIGWIDDGRFLAGYGAAQALPGPLFTISAYLGALAGKGVAGAVVALVGIFLPGFLILVGVLPFWTALRRNALVRAAIAGVNAAVVGILALALYDPLWTSSVRSWCDTLLVVVALIALLRWQLPSLAIVAGMAAMSLGLLAL